MQNPLNPLDNQIPPDDYMLDTLEQSIENPGGLTNPLAAKQGFFIDDITRQLNQVEVSIINTPPIPPDTTSHFITS